MISAITGWFDSIQNGWAFAMAAWPWVLGALLVGMVIGALIGRWAVALIVGGIVAVLLFFQRRADDQQVDVPDIDKRRPNVIRGKPVVKKPRTRTILDIFQ